MADAHLQWWTSHFLVQASSEDIEGRFRYCSQCELEAAAYLRPCPPADIISQLRKIYDDETYTSMKHEIRQALEQADRGNGMLCQCIVKEGMGG